MDAKYRELFILIAQSTANIAEEVMNLHKNNGEEKEFETAQIMRDDFLDLHNKLTDEVPLTKADFARILVGTIIVANQLENKIKNEQKALEGYKIDIIPKLDQINNETDEDKISQLVEELFVFSKDEQKQSDN